MLLNCAVRKSCMSLLEDPSFQIKNALELLIQNAYCALHYRQQRYLRRVHKSVIVDGPAYSLDIKIQKERADRQAPQPEHTFRKHCHLAGQKVHSQQDCGDTTTSVNTYRKHREKCGIEKPP